MTDKEKLEKVKAEIERRKKEVEDNIFELGNFESERIGLFDNKEIYNDLLSFIDSMQKEPKECMYSKGNYTDEDRKALCDGCEEKCKHDKSDDFTKALAECIHNAQCNVIDPMVFAEIWKDELIKLSKCEEPVSEDLEEAAKHYLYSNILYDDVYVGNPTDKDCIEMFKAGANWQKEQMIAKAVSGHVGQTINGMLRALSDETFGDMGFTAGDKVKLIIIKEE